MTMPHQDRLLELVAAARLFRTSFVAWVEVVDGDNLEAVRVTRCERMQSARDRLRDAAVCLDDEPGDEGSEP